MIACKLAWKTVAVCLVLVAVAVVAHEPSGGPKWIEFFR